MESLNALGSTCKVTLFPFTSWLRVASLWQVRHSSAEGLGMGLLPAASSGPPAKSRARAIPGAKRPRNIRVDMLSPANPSELEDLLCGSRAVLQLILPIRECR